MRLLVVLCMTLLSSCSNGFSPNCSDVESLEVVQQVAYSSLRSHLIWAHVIKPEEVDIEIINVVTKDTFERSKICTAGVIYSAKKEALQRDPRLVNLGLIANSYILYELERTDQGKLQATVRGLRI